MTILGLGFRFREKSLGPRDYIGLSVGLQRGYVRIHRGFGALGLEMFMRMPLQSYHESARSWFRKGYMRTYRV